MEIAILTSSRADFGFYKPLLNLLKNENQINFKLIVFGTHLSHDHGFTLNDIIKSGYENIVKVSAIPHGDKAIDITKTIANTHIVFADFWDNNKFDLIICIGDRYEMFASVSASIPFNIPVAHISGGEETLGAIDNIYRHCLTIMSSYHFTNTESNAQRVKQLKGSSKNIFCTGSLAVDNINETKLYHVSDFRDKFKFDISNPFILFTFHPETVNYMKNKEYGEVIEDVLSQINYSVLVTMPNADTMGGVIREALHKAAANNNRIHLIESLGSAGYYTALKNCLFVLGNSSSGIIEAASFEKYVINLGSRQLGREAGENVIHCKIKQKEIFDTIDKIEALPKLDAGNIYGSGDASVKILKVLKKVI